MGTTLHGIIEWRFSDEQMWSCLAEVDFGKDYSFMAAVTDALDRDNRAWPQDVSFEAEHGRGSRQEGHQYCDREIFTAVVQAGPDFDLEAKPGNRPFGAACAATAAFMKALPLEAHVRILFYRL